MVKNNFRLMFVVQGLLCCSPDLCTLHYSSSSDEAEHSCHFLATSMNRLSHCKVLTAIAAKIIHTTVQLCLTLC
jgi:hypothetical protein